jgi:5-methylcytosine-specific restriction endonuclease McrA
MPVGIYKRNKKQLNQLKKQGFKKGVKGMFSGRHHSLKTRKKLSKSHMGKNNFNFGRNHSGKNAPAWKGENGKCKNKEYLSWLKNKRNRLPKSGSHTWNEWQLLKAQYNWTCPSCHKKEPIIKLTQDHIIPLSKGGSDNIENIQPLCRSCNSKKRTIIINFTI